jgi:hypothetical protein
MASDNKGEEPMKQSYFRAPLYGVLLAAVFACTPAFAVQSGSYIDSPDGVWLYGYSYVQLDYSEYWEEAAEELVSSSVLYDPNGNALDSDEEEANAWESGYVESDVSGANDGSGYYYVIGDGQAYVAYDDIDLGETEAAMEFTDEGGGGCVYPDTDVSAYRTNHASPYAWAGVFDAWAYLSTAGGYPQDTWSGLQGNESWAGGDPYSSCASDAAISGMTLP